MSAEAKGYVDFHGWSRDAKDLVVGGWINFGWDEQATDCLAQIEFADRAISTMATMCLYSRLDVIKLGRGFILLLRNMENNFEQIKALTVRSNGRAYRLAASHTMQSLSQADLAVLGRQVLMHASDSMGRTQILQSIAGSSFTGVSTVGSLDLPVSIEIDAVHLCHPAGLLLAGWFADPFEQIASIRVQSGSESSLLDLEGAIRTRRTDIAEMLREKQYPVEERCGFLLLAAGISRRDVTTHLELRTRSGAVVYKPVPPPAAGGITGMKQILGCFALGPGDLLHGYDAVVGPAIQALNNLRLAKAVEEKILVFGMQPEQPRCSIIVPLYGRVDYLEYQLAFFSRSLSRSHELIYVLDDPALEGEAEALGFSCFARFGIPFRLIVLRRNVGYAAASNIGLRHAGGSLVCFLNSDVFPARPEWLEYMIETAERHTRIGVVGARLLFEDGTIQHDGCQCETQPELGGWRFPLHVGKGRLPTADTGIKIVEAVTGACLVMRRQLAIELGGFSEDYVIGDFEDADLCFKVRERDLHCVVDPRAELYHLERQSQGSATLPWRTNLTLFNAWHFNRKWFPVADETSTAQHAGS